MTTSKFPTSRLSAATRKTSPHFRSVQQKSRPHARELGQVLLLLNKNVRRNHLESPPRFPARRLCYRAWAKSSSARSANRRARLLHRIGRNLFLNRGPLQGDHAPAVVLADFLKSTRATNASSRTSFCATTELHRRQVVGYGPQGNALLKSDVDGEPRSWSIPPIRQAKFSFIIG